MVRTAYLYQKAIAYTHDDIKNEERQFLPGAIPFRYLSLKEQQVKEGKIAREKNTFIMYTRANVDFKSGDAVKVNNQLYSIIDVILTIDEKHQVFIERNPNARQRLETKELVLKR